MKKGRVSLPLQTDEDKDDSFPVGFAMMTAGSQMRVGMASFFCIQVIHVQHHIHGVDEKTLAVYFLRTLIDIDPGIMMEGGICDEILQIIKTEMCGRRNTACL